MNIMKAKLLLITCFIYISITASSSKIEAVRHNSRIDVLVDGKLFTSYVFSQDEKYPYFFPVNGPLSGASVTSMRNSLYPHQNSLFFACDKLNGGNYWQEGLERGQILSSGAKIVESGGDRAIISDECNWVRVGAESPLKDIRKITISAPDSTIRQIDFDIKIIPLTDIEILKTNHGLFSVRIATDLCVENGGVMINAQGDCNEKETFGKKSEWLDCYGKRGNVIEGLAIMQHPSNIMYPFRWFTRDYGLFSLMPFYWPDDTGKFVIRKGDAIELRYRVIVHTGDTRTAGIDMLFKDYSFE